MSKPKKNAPKDMNLVKDNPNCKDCIYMKKVSMFGKMCDYLELNEEPRGCPVDGCTKKVPKGQRKDKRVMDVEEKKREKKRTGTKVNSRKCYVKCKVCGNRFYAASGRANTCPACKQKKQEKKQAKKASEEKASEEKASEEMSKEKKEAGPMIQADGKKVVIGCDDPWEALAEYSVITKAVYSLLTERGFEGDELEPLEEAGINPKHVNHEKMMQAAFEIGMEKDGKTHKKIVITEEK